MNFENWFLQLNIYFVFNHEKKKTKSVVRNYSYEKKNHEMNQIDYDATFKQRTKLDENFLELRQFQEKNTYRVWSYEWNHYIQKNYIIFNAKNVCNWLCSTF